MKRYIKSAEGNVHTYIIKYGDGNAAASRGTEPEHNRQVKGYFSSDKLALIAASYFDEIDWWDDMVTDDYPLWILDEFYGEDINWLNEQPVEVLKDYVYSRDPSGGDALVYEILRDGKEIYYDSNLEDQVLMY